MMNRLLFSKFGFIYYTYTPMCYPQSIQQIGLISCYRYHGSLSHLLSFLYHIDICIRYLNIVFTQSMIHSEVDIGYQQLGRGG